MFFIAPMVEHAQDNRVFDVLLDDDGAFTSPPTTPNSLLRFAAHTMLQGPPDQSPYGWTHCLTLAQAPLMLAASTTDPSRAVFVAAAYLAAHWAGLGAGSVDPAFVPPPVALPLDAALDAGPAAAAGAAWHGRDVDATDATLATHASLAHDAHRVKYTLACLDAAAADPGHRSLYLAAAAALHAWWHEHPDLTDPLRDVDLCFLS
jgi:hypothetical protein